jgi:hypothetical protein
VGRCPVAETYAWPILDDRSWTLLLAVVMRNIAIGQTAELLGIPKPRLTQHLVAMLDRFCQHGYIRQAA